MYCAFCNCRCDVGGVIITFAVVQAFESSGELLQSPIQSIQIGHDSVCRLRLLHNPARAHPCVCWQPGSGRGYFDCPSGLAVLPGGQLAVADTNNHRVQVFDAATGRYVREFGRRGRGDGCFDEPVDVASLGKDIVVVDNQNQRVQVVDADGNFVAKVCCSAGGCDGVLVVILCMHLGSMTTTQCSKTLWRYQSQIRGAFSLPIRSGTTLLCVGSASLCVASLLTTL